MRLAAIYAEKLDKPHDAIDHYEAVVASDRTSKQAMEVLGALYRRVERWEDARKILDARLKKGGTPQMLVDLHLLKAEVLETGFRDARGAAEACQAALRHDPANRDANHRLREILYRTGDEAALKMFHERSIAIMRDRIGKNPFAAEAHARLRELFGWSQQYDREYIASGVCVVLGDDSPMARDVMYRHEETREKLARKRISPEAWGRELCPPKLRLATRRLFGGIAPYLEKLVPDSLERAGVTSRERVRSGPVWDDAVKLSEVVGLSSMELYVTEEAPRAVVGLCTSTPAIVIGAALAESRGSRRFALTRAMAEVVDGHARARLLNPAALLELILATIAAFEPGGANNMGLRHDPDLAKRVRKVAPRKARERLEAMAREALIEGPPVDPTLWVPLLPYIANRAGITLANDVGAALNAIALITGVQALSQETAIAEAREHPEAQQAITFALSEDHFMLRQALGISIFPG